MDSALEIFDRLTVGYTLLHRNDVGWDLLDGQRVVAVICVRRLSGWVTISLPRESAPQSPRPHAFDKMPYNEELVAHITRDGVVPKNRRKERAVFSVAQARDFLDRLIATPMSRAEGEALAAEIAARLSSSAA
ncbi:MAG TPA: hypothetical protein VGH79_08330 [Gaiellaceae bacterium]|jgi:hypothetical protein